MNYTYLLIVEIVWEIYICTTLYIYNTDTGKLDKHRLTFSFSTCMIINEFIYTYDYRDGYLKYIDINQIKRRNYIWIEASPNKYVKEMDNYINVINMNYKPYILDMLDINRSEELFKIVNMHTLEEYYKFTNKRTYTHRINLPQKIILFNIDNKVTYTEIDLFNKNVTTLNYPEKIKLHTTFIFKLGGKVLFCGENISYTYNFETKECLESYIRLGHLYSEHKILFILECDSKIYYNFKDNFKYNLFVINKLHISNIDEYVNGITFTSEVTSAETKISLNVLKERTSYFSNLSTKFDDDTICSLKIYNDDVEKYKNYIFTGHYDKNNILEIFKVCNYLQDIDTFSLSFKIEGFCENDIDFSVKSLSVLSNTEYSLQFKKLFNFVINNYDRNDIYDIISKESCYGELFKLMFYNIDVL